MFEDSYFQLFFLLKNLKNDQFSIDNLSFCQFSTQILRGVKRPILILKRQIKRVKPLLLPLK
jgi:hypothetical protein